MKTLRSVCLVGLVLGLAATGALAETNVAFAATVTASPAAGDTLKAALDGDLSTQLTFDVGTKGEGVITLTFDHPRAITGVRFAQNNEVYYLTAYAIEADPTGAGQFSLKLAEGTEAELHGWTEHRFAPVTVRAVRLRSVAGVSKGSRAHPCLSEFEVFGALEAGDLKLAAAHGLAVPLVPAPRPLERTTSLAVG